MSLPHRLLGRPLALPFGAGRLASRLAPAARVLAVVALINAVVVILVLGGLVAAAIGLAIIVPLVGFIYRRPQWGILAVAALVPYDGLLTILPLPSSAKDWKEVLVLITLGATFVSPRRAPGDRPKPGWTPAVVGLLLLGLVSAAAVGGNQALTGYRIDFFYVLLAVAIWRAPLTTRDRDRLVTVFMVNGVITSVYGVAQELLGAGRLAQLGYPYNQTIRYTHGFLRAFSTFSYQSPFGYFLMVVLLVGLSSALSDPSRRRSRLFFASLPLLGAAFFFTFERGAWLGFAGGMLYLSIRRWRPLLLGIPVLILVVALIPTSARSSSFSSSSLGERTGNWQSHISAVLLDPLGHGIGSSGAAAAKVAVQQAGVSGSTAAAYDVAGTTYNADNQYLTTAFDLGLIGLWLQVLLMIAAGRTSHIRAGPPGPGDDPLAAATAAVVIGYALGSTVAVLFEMFPMDVIWWLLITTAAVPGVGEPAPVASPRLAGADPAGQATAARRGASAPVPQR